MDDIFVREVVDLAKQSLDQGSFPNGALVIRENRVVCKSISISEQIIDPTAHAEISVIRAACQKEKKDNLEGYTLYTSLEPCLMCFHASYWAGIRKIVYCCTREYVSEKCFEGRLSVQEAAQYTHDKVELYYDNSLVDRVIALHQEFQAKIQ